MMIIYKLLNKKINDIEVYETEGIRHYNAYANDNEYIVDSNRDTLSKRSILLDLGTYYHFLFNDNTNNKIREIKGFTPNFLKKLIGFGITMKDLREVMDNARNYSMRKNNLPQTYEELINRSPEYTVGL